MANTIKYGIKNAPPPFSNAVNGNRHTFPRPTDIAMHDIKNSISFPQLARSDFVAFVVAVAVVLEFVEFSSGNVVVDGAAAADATVDWSAFAAC